MSPRTLTLLGGAALAGVAGAWLLFGEGADSGPGSPAPQSVESLGGSGTPSAIEPSSASRQPPAPTAPPPVEAAPAASPVRIESAVVPGMPMTRSTSMPPDPAALAPLAAGARPTARTAPEQQAGQSDVEDVLLMFRNFRTRLGENPVGTNAEMMKTVMGGNPVQANLGPPEGQMLNEQGELMDRWGTPYFFHQLSKTEMEIRSAGPDRLMWTGDDIITK